MAKADREFIRHKVQHHPQDSGTPALSAPRKLTKSRRRPRSPSLPNLPSLPAVNEHQAHASISSTTTTTTTTSDAVMGPSGSRGSKLLRSLSLRSVTTQSDSDSDKAYPPDNTLYRASTSSSSLWPPRWATISRRRTFGSRSSSARTSRTTLGTQEEGNDDDDDTTARSAVNSISKGKATGSDDGPQSPQFLPLIRVVSPLTLSNERDSDAHLRISTEDGSGKNGIVPRNSKISEKVQTEGPGNAGTRRTPKFTLESSGQDENDSDVEGTKLTIPSVSISAIKKEPSAPQQNTLVLQSPSSTTPFHLPNRLISRPHSLSDNHQSSSMPRPGLTRRTAAVGPSVSRRYTFAMAMNDEGISDEVLVEELERIRAVRTLSMGGLGRDSSEEMSLSMLDNSTSPDFEDVWDVETQEAPLDLQLELEDHSTCKRPHMFLDGQATVCDSPTSEDVWTLHFDHPPRSQNRLSLPPLSASTSQLPRPISLQPSSTDIIRWHTTRHALLTCRELVRTERHYTSSLISLLAGDTTTPPPSLMQHYVAVLLNASQLFLEKMENNPTPTGVAKAFVGLEKELETAYVGWCGVVGGWFQDSGKGKELSNRHPRASMKRLSKIRAPDNSAAARKTFATSSKDVVPIIPPTPTPTSRSSESTSSSSSSSESSSLAASPSSSASGCTSNTTPESSSCNSVPPSPSGSKANAPAVCPSSSFGSPFVSHPSRGKFSMSRTASAPASRRSSFTGVNNMDPPTSIHGPSVSGAKPARKSLLRDLAILPTQRVMRYVLLFQDLLAHAPPNSASRAEVQRAVEAADRIARQCDRAQNNAAFIHTPPPPSTPGPNTVTSNTNTNQGGSQPVKSERDAQARTPSLSLRAAKPPDIPERDKAQTSTRKLTKSRNHRRSGSTHEFRPGNAEHIALPRTSSTVEDDYAAIRSRSQSHTNLSSASDVPRQGSSQRLSVLNLSIAIGGFLGRSLSQHSPDSIDSPRKKSGHPPSSFSHRDRHAADGGSSAAPVLA
ncbi:hypothetical protein FA15DRAFT_663012 [Coprinopsis marcescibilis]|uniref:DH domain-containing protein n=1 Tax=Coprinopsis marcescibilis TaxID=230819 RepID=A0A5C3LCX8_COPMA|nr:hypothetical protein FA15DRAFT_663012 [Coprinopsis marcescibilis]